MEAEDGMKATQTTNGKSKTKTSKNIKGVKKPQAKEAAPLLPIKKAKQAKTPPKEKKVELEPLADSNLSQLELEQVQIKL